MKIFITSTGGSSPGITIHGSREHVIQFANRLKEEAEKPREEGSIRFPELAAHGDPYEWIEFQVVHSVEPMIAAQKKKSKWWLVSAGVIWSCVIAVLYFAYRGIKSL
jgi:hypothetical protein